MAPQPSQQTLGLLRQLLERLFAFGYSAPEIAEVIKELADKGSNYSETRDIEQSALEKYGF